MNQRNRRLVVVYTSLLAGLLLAMFPLPNWAEALRPDWVALILIYWCITLPMQIGLTTGFIFGLLLDIAMGTLLGQHALGLILVSFIIVRIHARLRMYPQFQQGVLIMFALFLMQLVYLWVYGITNRAPDNLWLYFLPSFIGMLLWPFVSKIMRNVERRFLNYN